MVVGLGKVGRALFELLEESAKFAVYGFDIKKERICEVGQTILPSEVDVMHICIPCSDRNYFLDSTVGYVKRFNLSL